MRQLLSSAVVLVAFALAVGTASAAQPPTDSTAPPPPPCQPPESQPGADTPSSTYDEQVIVTAEKWEAPPSTVPLSLTVVTPGELAASGAILLNQIGPAVPGLFLRNDGDRSFNKPSLRGITSSPFNDPAVSVYVDDVPVDPRMGLATPLIDLQQIEVVRGPHGVVWGRNTSGGLVHVVTALPGAVWTRRAEVSVGSFGEVVVPFSAQGPIADRVFLGVSGVYEGRGGFLDNPVNADEVDRRQGLAGRVQLRWLPSNRWDVQLRSDTGLWRDGAFLASRIGAEDSYVVRSDSENREDSHILQQSARIRREGSRATVLFVAARRQSSVYRISDEDLGDTPPQEYTWSDLRDTRWNGEVRVLAPERSRVRWLAGAYAGSRDATDAYETYLPVIFNGYSERNGATYRDRTLAAFGQLRVPFGTRVHVTAGLRLDRDRKRMIRADRLFGAPTPTPEDDAVAPGFVGARTFAFLSPRTSVDVTLAPGLMVFGGLARGARSGGFNFTSDTPARAGFAGEYVLSVEGGVKARSRTGRAEVAVSTYRSFITDLQFQQFVGGFFAVANAGSAAARGLEVEGRAAAGRGVRVRGNYAWTSATLGDFDTGFADYSGNRIPAVPRYTALAAVDWGGRRGLEVSGEVASMGRIFFDEANVSTTPAYGVVNLLAGVRRARWAVHLYARNATGTRYVTMIAPGFYQVPGLPRRFGISISTGGRP